MKITYHFVLLLFLLVGGSNAAISRNLDPAQLSGNISLTLKHGIWKLWENKPVYQDIILDLRCNQGHCEPEIWGYAPKFNQDVDHQGTVEITQLENAWRLNVKLKIQSHPWDSKLEIANYTIEIVPNKDRLIGSYSGTFRERFLQGSLQGIINPLYPTNIANYQPITPQEHPRLIFRKSQLQLLREKAKTPAGEAILARLKKTLNTPISYNGYVPNGGYHAAGYCLLSLLNQDKKASETAWKIVENSMNNPGKRLLEHSPIVAGVALAYDLCYNAWNEERIKKLTSWLGSQTDWLIKGSSSKTGWNNAPWSNWNARAKGAAGLAALAILDEPQAFFERPTDTHLSYQLAERNIQRYLTTAIGDHGLGTEGDHYTTEPLILTVFPFLQAYQNVVGKDLVKGSSAAWILPHYIMRIVEKNGKLEIPAYGRHRYYPGGSLLTMGLGTTPEPFLPGVMEIFNRYLGLKGDKTFGVNSPQEAAFALAGYRDNIKTENPIKIFGHVLVDEQKGFYIFRNQWQGKNDFVASIYLKKEFLGRSWSFPDVGSFRIWGLGSHWANPGSSQGNWDDENVAGISNNIPWNYSKPIFFQSSLNGSGIVSLQTNTIWQKNSNTSVGIALLRSFAVDYSSTSGSPGLFVVVDKFIKSENTEEFKDKTWVMNTEGKVTIDDQSFTIQSANKTTMKGTFITPASVKISVKKSSVGKQIIATGDNDFFVIMTVQQGAAPKMKIFGTGLDAQVKIGNQEVSFQNNRIIFSKF